MWGIKGVDVSLKKAAVQPLTQPDQKREGEEEKKGKVHMIVQSVEKMEQKCTDFFPPTIATKVA